MSPNLNVAVVCSSNMNRSMEAHAVLAKKNFKVSSFGTGAKIKIPGATKKEPNCYDFGTTYEEIYHDLLSKDRRIYTENGMLHILDRNRRIKPKPEKFQDCQDKFDLVITCEEKVYDSVIAHLEENQERVDQPVHVINIDVIDNPEDATIGAFIICDIVSSLACSEDIDDEIADVLQGFEARVKRPILHTISFY